MTFSKNTWFCRRALPSAAAQQIRKIQKYPILSIKTLTAFGDQGFPLANHNNQRVIQSNYFLNFQSSVATAARNSCLVGYN